MPKTFELVNDAGKVALMLEESGGEFTEEASIALDKFLEESGDKLAGIRAVRLHLEAKAALYREEAHRFHDARKEVEKNLENVNGYALLMLQSRTDLGEKQKQVGVGFTVLINRRDRAELAEGVKLEELPDELIREKTTRTFDKATALAKLREGQTIPGVERLWGETVVWK